MIPGYIDRINKVCYNTSMSATATDRPETYKRAIITVAQSIKCHRDWDLETHLSYLESEGFDLDESITIATWPAGPRSFKLRDYVKSWVSYPNRCIEVASQHARSYEA